MVPYRNNEHDRDMLTRYCQQVVQNNEALSSLVSNLDLTCDFY